MIIDEYFEAKMNAQYRKLCLQEVAKQIQNMKQDIITNISDDNRWIDYILEIQDYLPEIPEERGDNL